MDQLTETLLAETDQLRSELEYRANELEDGRRRLAERGRQLAEQRKETGRLTHLLEQQDVNLGEALQQLKGLREQIDRERDESRLREDQRVAGLEQRLRECEAERDEMRHQLQVLQASASAGTGGGESLAPLLSELGDLRRQSAETHAELAQTRSQLSEAIERAAAARPTYAAEPGDVTPLTGEGQQRLSELERERPELEAELELVRTRAAELQETVNAQRRELTEQRSEFAAELRSLRELVEQNADRFSRPAEEPGELVLAGPSGRAISEPDEAPADPVISSVMAQFARLQKDVAQRRKKK